MSRVINGARWARFIVARSSENFDASTSFLTTTTYDSLIGEFWINQLKIKPFVSQSLKTSMEFCDDAVGEDQKHDAQKQLDSKFVCGCFRPCPEFTSKQRHSTALIRNICHCRDDMVRYGLLKSAYKAAESQNQKSTGTSLFEHSNHGNSNNL